MRVDRFNEGDRVRARATGAVGTITRRPAFRNDYFTVTWDEEQPFGVKTSKISPLSLTHNFDKEDA